MEKEQLLQEFSKIYGDRKGVKVYFAPGRVNLIGEHVDYNGGHVFPCALTLGTYGVARLREDSRLRFYSMNFPEKGICEGDIHALVPGETGDWTNYPKGVMWAFQKKGCSITKGMDIMLYGNIPSGAGLSSSASVEVMTGVMLRDLFGFELSNIEIALLGQQAEHEFCGVNCGIMDQFAAAMGKENHAIYLNADTLEYEYIPVNLSGAKIVLANSNKKHSLADSKYNERRQECEAALEELQTVIGVEKLCQLDSKTYDMYEVAIKDEIRRNRAHHAVYENERTKQAAEVLKNGDLQTFGRLLKESHISLSEDYEVTGEEMDALAEAAWHQEGVIGSRITGGGFGGCTVSLVVEEKIPDFTRNVGKEYTEKTGLKADFYVVEIGGAPVVL